MLKFYIIEKNEYTNICCIICKNKIIDSARFVKCLYAGKENLFLEAYLHVFCYANIINTPKLLENLTNLLDEQLAEM